MKIYSIYDTATEQYAPPFFADNIKIAHKIVRQSIVPGSVLLQYPGDYHLWYLGDINLDDGTISQDDKVDLCCLSELVPPSLYDSVLDGSVSKYIV